MAADVSSSPSYWVHKNLQVGHKLVDDPQTRTSVDKICKSRWKSRLVGKGKDAINLDHSGVQITGVKRIENPAVFDSYSQKIRELQNRGCRYSTIKNIPKLLAGFNQENRLPDVNEYYLFHGTDAAIDIAKMGFKTRFADPGNMFGEAIYFTDNFMKADQYSGKYDFLHFTQLNNLLLIDATSHFFFLST